ncbi:MAG: hypothetical protein V2A76_02525, partial [Planctomycetota bacterium]
MGPIAPLKCVLRPSVLAFSLLLLLPSALLAQADAQLEFNQKFRGLISGLLDQDLVEFEEAEGSLMTLTLTRDSGNQMRPMIELLDQSMTVIPLGNALTVSRSKAKIKKFPAPYGGTYFVRLSSMGQTGTYKCTFKGAPPRRAMFTDAIGVAAEIDEVTFSVRAGSTLSGSIKRVSGDLIPYVIELEGPDGNLVPIGGRMHLNGSGRKLNFSGITVNSLGTCRLRLTGQNGTTGNYLINLSIIPPKPEKGTVFEDEHPGSGGSTQPEFTLSEISFGRGLKTGVGPEVNVVSPFSTVTTDPISNLPIEGTLRHLFVGGDLGTLVDFNLGPVYGPPVVPRNAVLKLEFTRGVLLESLNLDADSLLTATSPILVTGNGALVPIEATVSGKTVFLNPVAGGEVGFPASPLAYDAAGNPMASVLGAARIEIISTGFNALKSSSGGNYAPRSDLLGSSDVGGSPIGFNPGN